MASTLATTRVSPPKVTQVRRGTLIPLLSSSTDIALLSRPTILIYPTQRRIYYVGHVVLVSCRRQRRRIHFYSSSNESVNSLKHSYQRAFLHAIQKLTSHDMSLKAKRMSVCQVWSKTKDIPFIVLSASRINKTCHYVGGSGHVFRQSAAAAAKKGEYLLCTLTAFSNHSLGGDKICSSLTTVESHPDMVGRTAT